MTKQYLSENAELMKEWDWEANADLDPNKITCGSHKKVCWKCPKCGYKWQQAIVDISRLGHLPFCPLCTNRIVVKGKNDLASTYPDIANLQNEWPTLYIKSLFIKKLTKEIK